MIPADPTKRRAPGRLRVGTDRLHVVLDLRGALVVLLAGACLLALLLWALAAGDYPLTPTQVLGAFTGSSDGLDRTVVLDWRLPRAATAIAFGAALALSGAIFQTVTRNPLASPDVIGLANGSYTGMILALLFLGGAWPLLIAGSFAGGLAAAGLIAALAARDGLRSFRFIIIGIGVSAMLAAVNTWLLLRADLETALFAAAWGAGSLNAVTATTAWPAIACLLLLAALLPAVSRSLRQLALGDDVARGTGLPLARSRLMLVGLGVALVGVVTAIAGPIAFVALSAPQIARRLSAAPAIPLAASAAVGAVLLLGADLIAQHLVPLTVPVGVVTVIGGGAYLVWLLARELRKGP